MKFKISDILKTNEKFLYLLKEIEISFLEKIKYKDGPAWGDRVKRAEMIKLIVTKTINKTESDHLNNFLDYKESLIELILEKMSKLLNQSVTIEDDEFKINFNCEISESEFNKACISIIEMIK